MKFDSIESALVDIQQGKMVIVVDDENRENEGDLILSAQHASPEIINTMIKLSSGLLCVPMAQSVAEKLNLKPMVQTNTAHFKVNFTVSIDAAQGISTGASVVDKAHTIKLLVQEDAHADHFVSPGHIFPLVAKPGGVLQRPGHTEAAVDLMRLSGLSPIALITEVVNPDGSMARLPALYELSKKMEIKLISIQDLITYRYNHEQTIRLTSTIKLPTHYGDFLFHMFENDIDQPPCFALTKENFLSKTPALVRIHSECFTGDIFCSKRCDCGEQLDMALELLQKQESGILIYLRQEGRGIGLRNKIKAYEIQERGFDTVEANHQLGFSSDLRNYSLAAQVLKYFNQTNIRLLTNNVAKIIDLKHYGVTVQERVPLEAPLNESNRGYLNTKKTKMGHLFSHL